MNGSIWLMPVAYLLVSGCASLLDGSHQRLSIETRYKDSQVIGATCMVRNDRGVWTVTTPGSLTLNWSSGDLSAKCEKEGFAAGSLALQSASKELAFVYILVGGVIGTIVDVATGAAYDYPSSMTVEMGEPAFSLVSNPGKFDQSRSAVLLPSRGGAAELLLYP